MARRDATIQLAQLEHHVREDLNERAPRVMAVLRPLRVVIENYPENQVEELEAVNNPQDPSQGTRTVPFSRVIYLERDDFLEVGMFDFWSCKALGSEKRYPEITLEGEFLQGTFRSVWQRVEQLQPFIEMADGFHIR